MSTRQLPPSVDFEGWEAVIGLETHVQLATASKLFSGAAARFGAEPNRQACAIDLAMPGTLPVPNRAAVEMAVRFGLAVGGQIAAHSVFARKNYFYPDLPKGYQISQYETPIVRGGVVRFPGPSGALLDVPLVRAHLEEDAGKSVHDAFHAESAIDLNRAGTPLIEIVTEPVLHDPAQAAAYLRMLHTLVRYLGLSDGDMERGNFRCDANVSVRRRSDSRLGTRVEIKNLNSFRFLEKAIAYEVERQIRLLERGGVVEQETRLFDPARGETRSMRSKEEAHDYRYFPDPDLPPLELSKAEIERIAATLPELPLARCARYQDAFGLTAYEAGSLAFDKDRADYFEAVLARVPGAAKRIAAWLMGEVAAALNQHQLEFGQLPIAAEAMAGLIRRIEDGTLSQSMAKTVFEALWNGAASADQAIAALGLKQISDESALVAVIDEVLARCPEQVRQFQQGQEKVLQFLIGQVMKATRGQAHPGRLNALLRSRLHDLPK